MRPGKRPGNPRSNRFRNHFVDKDAPPPTWSLQMTNKLQRCIVTHDLEHILSWHTPAYTAAVAVSLIAVLVGASTFSGWFAYLALCAASALVVGGVGVWLEVESGSNAVMSPAEANWSKTGVRSKPTVESNVRAIYTRVLEPLLKEVTSVMFPAERGDAFTKKWLVGILAVTLVAELAKCLPTGVVLAIVVAITFGITGVQKVRAS